MKHLIKALCLMLLLLCITFDASYAGWIENGVPLTHQFTVAGDAQITSDGSSGAIIVFRACYDGVVHIVAQHVDSLGGVLWGEEGIDLCTVTGTQEDPQITSDGAGGAIVTWWDNRSGDSDIYAQRVNGSGEVQWTTDGVALCTATGNQRYPQITYDGAGGAIVTWHDGRSGNDDIYAQRVDAAGTVQWTADGITICAATGDQNYPVITSDSAGGAIMVWEDDRCTSLIFAQRVRASGEIVATMLQYYLAALEGGVIRIGWTLSEIDEDAHFSILRASAPDWEYIEFNGARVDRNGFSFTFTDETCLPGSMYKYRVDCEVEGAPQKILFETDAVTIPALTVILYQNHPNPFNPQTVIRFYLPQDQEIFMDVYDVTGERVARLVEGKKENGYHRVMWDGRNSSGSVCSSGLYFYRLKAGKNAISRKMVIMC